MPQRAVVRTGPRERTNQAPGSLAVAPKGGASREPTPLRCVGCGTTWYSRVANLIVESGMSCARCGAPLAIPDADD
jgi:hypothetical protein